jgi:polyketide cyclase/dehydrase/lipid transport protein
MALYEFETEWRLRAPLAEVWSAIVDSWPEWWRGVERVELLKAGDEQGIGAVRRMTWRSRLPYTLTFDIEVMRVEPMTLIEGRASGELEGTGTWRLGEADGVTTVHYTWRVRTTRWWMNLLAPIARPNFRWNHDYVMARGGEGLAGLLGAELLQS